MNTVTTLFHMMISSIILYWNMTYMCIRFPQWSHWSLQDTVSAVKKQYEKLHDRWYHTYMHFCVVSLVQAVQICTKLCFWYVHTKTHRKNAYV